MRRVLLALLLSAASAAPAGAGGRDASAVVADLTKGSLAGPAAVTELTGLPVADLAAQLKRPRTSTLEQRRAVLRAIKGSQRTVASCRRCRVSQSSSAVAAPCVRKPFKLCARAKSAGASCW